MILKRKSTALNFYVMPSYIAQILGRDDCIFWGLFGKPVALKNTNFPRLLAATTHHTPVDCAPDAIVVLRVKLGKLVEFIR